jgi:plasmid stabilization system protein ParE
MAYKIRYLPIASADIAQAVDYIAITLSNVAAASAFLDELDRIVAMIVDNPYTFRIYERLDSEAEEVRVASVKRYYLFYTIVGDMAEVKRVVYQKRDIGAVYRSGQ